MLHRRLVVLRLVGAGGQIPAEWRTERIAGIVGARLARLIKTARREGPSLEETPL